MNLKGCAPQPFWLMLEDARSAYYENMARDHQACLDDEDYEYIQCPFCRITPHDTFNNPICDECWFGVMLIGSEPDDYNLRCQTVGSLVLSILNGETDG